MQQPLEREQIAAASLEPVRGFLGHCAQIQFARLRFELSHPIAVRLS